MKTTLWLPSASSHAIEPLEARIAPAAVTWIKDADGDWDDPTNWSGHAVPDSTSDVTLPALATPYVVTVRTGAQEVHSLTSQEALSLTGGSLTLDAASSTHGDLSLNGGGLILKAAVDTYGTVYWNHATAQTEIDGPGTLTSHGTTELGGAPKTLTTTFVNAGTFHVNGGGFSGPTTGVLMNLAGATINLEGGVNFQSGTINNAGTLNSTGGAQFDIGTFNNTGTVHVSAGSLQLASGGTNSATFNVDSGAQLLWSTGPGGGLYHLASGASLTGPGLYEVAGFDTVSLDTGANVSPANLRMQDYSQLGGPGTLTLASGAFFDYGAQLIGSGKVIIAAGATATVSLGASLYQETLEVDGTLNINGLFSLDDGATLNVPNHGVVNLQNGHGISGSSGDTLHIMAGGTMYVSGAGATAGLYIIGSNAGLIEVAAGTLLLPTTLSVTGSLQADAGTTIQIAGSGVSFLSGAQWLGTGLYKVTGHATFASGITFAPHALEVDGVFDGAGNLQIGSGATLTINGVLGGTGSTQIANGGTVTGLSLDLEGGRSLTNAGAITVHALQAGENGGAFSNLTNQTGGTINVLPDTNGFTNFNGQWTVGNAGTIHLDASGMYGANFYVDLTNTGLVTVSGGLAYVGVSSGTANFQPSSSGELHVDAGATLSFISSYHFNSGATFTGAGTFQFSYALSVQTLAAGVTLNPQNLVLFNSEVDGPGTLSAGPGARWTISTETLLNLGTFTIASSAIVASGNDNYDNSVTLTGTNIDNFGKLDFVSGFHAELKFTDASGFTNETSGVVNFGSDSYGFRQFGGPLVNRGVMTFDPGADSHIQFQVGSYAYPLNNSGTLIVKSGYGYAPGLITQVSADGSTLTGGTWEVLGGSTFVIAGAILTVNQANVTISGPGASFFGLYSPFSDNEGHLSVLAGATLSINSGSSDSSPGPLTNGGTLEIGADSTVTVTGDYTQTSSGTLLLHVGGTVASGHYGRLTVNGQANLGGQLQLTVDTDSVPKTGNVYPLIGFGSLNGSFATENGVAPFFLETVTASGETFAIQNVPSDLQPTAVTIPASGSAGQNVTVGYTIHNGATFPTNGSHWTDSVYFSTRATFDGSAVLLGRTAHQGSLAGGASYTGSLTAPLPTLLSGNYHVFVVTDSRNEVAEVSESNNTLAAPGTLHVNVPVLTFGTPLNGTIAAGQDELYLVHLPTGADHLSFSSSVAGAAEVYLSKGAPPAVNGADFFTYDPANTLQDIALPQGGNADYYVLVHGREGAAAGTSFTLDAEAIPFGITGIGPVAATNNGPVTLAIHGGQFNLGTIFELVKHGVPTGIINSTHVSVQDGTLAYVTFDLTGHTATGFDVVAINGASSVSDPSAFQILPAPLADPGLQVIFSLSAPAGIRVGRPATLLVTYHNLTGHDVPAPLLVLTADNADFYDGTERYTKFIEFYGVNTGGGDESTLPAGYSGTRFLQYLPEVPQVFLQTTLHLALASTTAPLDLDKLDIEARPSGDLTDAQWTAVRAQLVTQLGTNYGDYANVLRADIPLLPAVLGDERSPIDLLSIEVQKAEAAINTSIHGQLGAAPTGVTLAGGLVIAENTDTGEVFSTRSFNDGSFIFGDVTAGHYTFQYDQALVTNGTPLVVAAAQHNTPVTLALGAAGHLAGSLGAAAVAGDVVATGADGTVFSAPVDPTGHYRFGALPAGAYTLTAAADGLASTTLANVPVALGDNTQNFTLTPEAVLSGHVTIHKGGPINDTIVSAVSATDPTAAPFSVQVGADGTYALHGLPAGTYTVTAQEDGYIPASSATITVTAGQTASVTDLPLVVAGSISGTVTGDSTVFSGEQIGAYLNGVLTSSAPAAANGTFTIANLPPGAYSVHPVDATTISTSKTVTLAEGKALTGVALTSNAGGSIQGTLTHQGVGTPFVGALVTATEPDGTVLTALTDNQGHYEFDGLNIGTYTVQAHAGTNADSEAAVTVATLKTSVTKDLISNASGHVHGLLSLNGTTPVSGGQVDLLENGSVIASTTTGDDGLFSFQVADTGPGFTLRAESDAGTFPASASFSVAAAADVPVNLQAGNDTLHVPITDSAGSVAGASVSLIDVDTGLTVTSVAAPANGVVDFAHLTPGHYQVYVSQTGNRGALVAATVAGSQATTNAPAALSAQGTLSGHVTGLPTGAGAEVDAYLTGSPGVAFSTQAAADGSYTLPNLPIGSYKVMAVSNGLAAPAQASGITVGTSSSAPTDLAVSSTSGRLVDGTVIGADGKPIPDATVEFLDASGAFIGQANADEKGFFQLRLPAGTYQLRISTKYAAPVDFLGMLQPVNDPPKNMPNSPEDLGSISAFFQNSADSGAFDPLYATLNALGFGKLTNQFKLYDAVVKEVKDGFMKSKNHVNALPSGTSCPGCTQETQDALFAVDKQTTAYDMWKYIYDKLLYDSNNGEKAIRDETLNNLNAVISTASLFAGVGEIVLEVKGAAIATKLGISAERELAEIAAKKSLLINTADLTGKCKDFAMGVSDLLMIANQGFQPSDQPDQDVEYLRQVSSAENKVVGLLGTIVSSVQDLKAAEKVLLKGGGVISSVLDTILNLQSTIESLNFTKSQMAAEKVDQDLTKFKQDKQPYEDAADNAHEKKVALEKCLKNNAADPNCNPNPSPGNPKNKPLPPDGPDAPGSTSTQANSLDPNSLDGPAGFGSAHFVSAQNPLPYTIHFENVSTASAPAAEVRITEQLDSNLDYSTFQLGDFSFGDFHISVPAGHSRYSVTHIDATATLGVFVNFSASADLHTGKVTWDLSAIDPATGDTPGDASLGFLPPNDAAHHGEGSVSYTVSANTSAATGATITAQASIVFDANAAISTPVVTNTLDAIAPHSSATAPASAGPDFTVSWAGSDDANGSGIAFYDVYVKDDTIAGSTFQPFLLHDTHAAGVFTGVVGHTYEFFSVAQDAAGNREAQPTSGQTNVTVHAATSYSIATGHPGKYTDALGKSYTVTLTGPGQAALSFVNGGDMNAHADIRAIQLTGTTAASTLTVTEAKGGAIQVGRIDTGGGTLGSVSLGAGVTLGDGLDDGTADLHVGGTLGKLTLGDLNNNALVRVGDQLSSALAAKAAPLPVTLGNVLGDGVRLEFSTKLGAVKLHSWAYAGLLQSSLGAASLTDTTGDLVAAVDVLSGNLGPVSIQGGSLTDGSFTVAGSLTSLTVKGFLNGQVTTGSLGSLTSGSGLFGATVLAFSGGIGNVVSNGPFVSSVLEADHGAIGNLTVNLTKQAAPVNAIDNGLVSALAIGKITAGVSGTAGLTGARGILNSNFLATAGNIGAIAATVSGAALADGAAIEGTSFVTSAGSIGAVSAHVTSGSAAPGLAALRGVNFSAHLNLGSITAVALATNLHPTGGSVTGLQDSGSSPTIAAGGSIGALTVSASGSTGAVGIGIAEGLRLAVSAGTSLGPISVTANKSTGHGAFALSRVSFSAGTTIGAVTVAGSVTGTQVFDSSFIAGGRIASINVSAKVPLFGTLDQTTIIAGAAHGLVTAADLTTGGLGPVTISGSVYGSKIAAAGSLGALSVGVDATGNIIAAGDEAGPDLQLFTADDTYYRAATIASLRVGGAFNTTSVVAGIDPGADHSFGGSDDGLGLTVAAIRTAGHLGPITLGAVNVNTGVPSPFVLSPVLPHLYAIESATLASIAVGKLKPLTAFTAAEELSATGQHDPANDLIRKVTT